MNARAGPIGIPPLRHRQSVGESVLLAFREQDTKDKIAWLLWAAVIIVTLCLIGYVRRGAPPGSTASASVLTQPAPKPGEKG
jgi:hypothetical protein